MTLHNSPIHTSPALPDEFAAAGVAPGVDVGRSMMEELLENLQGLLTRQISQNGLGTMQTLSAIKHRDERTANLERCFTRYDVSSHCMNRLRQIETLVGTASMHDTPREATQLTASVLAALDCAVAVPAQPIGPFSHIQPRCKILC